MLRWTIATGMALTGALSLGAQDPAPLAARAADPARTQLVIFLTPTDAGLDALPRELACVRDALAKASRAVVVRLVLLVSDFTKVGKETTTNAFIALVKELTEFVGDGFEMRLVDEEGLALAAKLGIARTPAWALVHRLEKGASGPRAHVAYGPKPKFTEVVKCRLR